MTCHRHNDVIESVLRGCGFLYDQGRSRNASHQLQDIRPEQGLTDPPRSMGAHDDQRMSTFTFLGNACHEMSFQQELSNTLGAVHALDLVIQATEVVQPIRTVGIAFLNDMQEGHLRRGTVSDLKGEMQCDIGSGREVGGTEDILHEQRDEGPR
jgi:hypothetical protein